MNMKLRGFTLIELAMVLFIVSLAMGGLLPPLANRMEIVNRAESLKQLKEIREYILGYAIINASLPCPSSSDDASTPDYGIEDCSVSSGFLPWKSIGMSRPLDPYNKQWLYSVDENFKQALDIATNTTPPGDQDNEYPVATITNDAAQIQIGRSIVMMQLIKAGILP